MDEFSTRIGELGVFYIIKASKISGSDVGYVVDFNTREFKIDKNWIHAYNMLYPFDAKVTCDFLRTKFEDYKFEILQIKIETKKYIGG